jgi:CTD small phosphatase-like protein 2
MFAECKEETDHSATLLANLVTKVPQEDAGELDLHKQHFE